jgi:hypothetical protein
VNCPPFPISLSFWVELVGACNSIDSGSSHSFISSRFLEKVGITPLPTTPKPVKVANEEVLLSNTYVPNIEWRIQGLLSLLR